MRDGDDLVSILDLTLAEATLGAEREVATVDGDDVTVTVEPGTQPGEMITLTGRGVGHLRGPGRGDHRIVLNVRVPTNLSNEQRSLIDDFAALETERNYDVSDGFVSKLRRLFRA